MLKIFDYKEQYLTSKSCTSFRFLTRKNSACLLLVEENCSQHEMLKLKCESHSSAQSRK